MTDENCFHVRDLGLGYTVLRGINNRGQYIAERLGSRAPGTQVLALYYDGEKTIDLPSLGGGGSHAGAVNQQGVVVGSATTPENAPNNYAHAARWKDGVVTDLGTLPGGKESIARAIADNGDIVGESDAGDGATHAVLWRDGVMVDLGKSSGYQAFAEHINVHGQVLGGFVRSYAGVRGSPIFGTLFWDNGTTTGTDLVPPGINADQTDIMDEGLNAHGAAVITLADRGGSSWLWSGGTFTAITPFPDSVDVSVTGINDDGYVAGSSLRGADTDSATGPYGFLWKDGNTTPIVSPLGDAMLVRHLDAHGQVAGEAMENRNLENRAFTWRDGKFVYLTDATVWGAVTAMNDMGQIAVLTGLGNDSPHSSLLFDTADCFDSSGQPPSGHAW